MRDPANNPWFAVPAVIIPGLILAWVIDWLMNMPLGLTGALLMGAGLYAVMAVAALLGLLGMIIK